MYMKKKIKKYVDSLLKGIYAGFMIGIGAIAFLSLENKVLGSFFFSIGLLTICMYAMNLYTGKVGYILINKIEYIYELCKFYNVSADYLLGFTDKKTPLPKN